MRKVEGIVILGFHNNDTLWPGMFLYRNALYDLIPDNAKIKEIIEYDEIAPCTYRVDIVMESPAGTYTLTFKNPTVISN